MMTFKSTFLLCFAIKMLVYNCLPIATTVALSLSSETDKLALLALKEKLTNGVPDALPSWNESLHFCEWQGVTCGRRHMRVSALRLTNQTLGGILGPSLGNLTFLRELNLTNINLHGEIPKQIGRLKRLQLLNLKNNKLQGEIPIELSNCTNIKVINLLQNQLTGRVPTWFESMKKLTRLFLGTNNLVGTIPSSLKNLSSLQRLSLTENHLEGRIPYSLGRLSSLILLYLASNDLSGTGSFGSVYKGSLLHFERPIVVKVLNLQTRGAAKSFMAECKALGKMKHRNLLKILTCCSSIDYNGEDFKAIVFDFMPNGSLENLLHDIEGSENHNLNFTQRVDIALDVAHALDYLHNGTDQVLVHCDVKPSNVLLDDDIVAHLGDFGLARLILGATGHSSKDQVNSSTIKGTIGYLPPEYGAGGPVSPEGDIYSYGILLLEMLTGKKPTNNMFYENLSLHKFCKMKISEDILDIVDSCLLIPFAEDQTRVVENNTKQCLMMFAEIGVACSEEFPSQRMLIKDVIVKLLAIKQKLSC
ncbi:probable LRR receptor-like serine/threonine-protein kinase At3g47570 isoform X2 [Trifolium pratense]|uniref:probable LRR receptor-like serine/threonine-protein kinase At3g47570 isoform X2 n=1 Tax=Trifolium pratense TaxID=57577 RepID=UPI001E6950F6|nr:probable LRR receptor-like serine/threonine-protein kinase At3g47570 isoform X2 [Trifolium pratense]